MTAHMTRPIVPVNVVANLVGAETATREDLALEWDIDDAQDAVDRQTVDGPVQIHLAELLAEYKGRRRPEIVAALDAALLAAVGGVA